MWREKTFFWKIGAKALNSLTKIDIDYWPGVTLEPAANSIWVQRSF
jgi:hypothetical protein